MFAAHVHSRMFHAHCGSTIATHVHSHAMHMMTAVVLHGSIKQQNLQRTLKYYQVSLLARQLVLCAALQKQSVNHFIKKRENHPPA